MKNIADISTQTAQNADALEASDALGEIIKQEINERGGWIPFERFMHYALYAPSLGYYNGGAKKFGVGGDFITAPELGREHNSKDLLSISLFAQVLSRQVQQVLTQVGGDILELGAGSGKLAADLLLVLEQTDSLPDHYYILEVSAYLRYTQQSMMRELLPDAIYQRVVWLDELPTKFTGMVLANEVLDALPVHVIKSSNNGHAEMGVSLNANNQFIWSERKLTESELCEKVQALNLGQDYLTEVCLATHGLLNSLAKMLESGCILLIDYGFPRAEYYHPSRQQGTLMCHYRHQAHDNPLIHIGLQDITAHVDFTAVAEAGIAGGLQLIGYINQAQFLINCGITQVLAHTSAENIMQYTPLASQAQKLLSPAEMGELFKVIAFSKNTSFAYIGFVQGDKTHKL